MKSSLNVAEVRFVDGRSSQNFYYDDVLGRYLRGSRSTAAENRMAFDPRQVSLIEVAAIAVIIVGTAMIAGALYALWAT